MQKNNKGITVIVLVITIIVLLILASITIYFLTGENGIVAKAQSAQLKTQESEGIEKVKLAVQSSYNTDSTINTTELKDNLNEIKGIDKIIPESQEITFPLNISVNSEEIQIQENGNVSKFEEKKVDIFKAEDKVANGLTINLTDDGVISIKGKATSNSFIKISNGIKVYSNGNDLIEVEKQGNILIPSGTKVKEKVTLIKKDVTFNSTKQINFVLRVAGNIASNDGKVSFMNMVPDGEKTSEFTLSKDVYMAYYYINKDTEIFDFQAKVELLQE